MPCTWCGVFSLLFLPFSIDVVIMVYCLVSDLFVLSLCLEARCVMLDIRCLEIAAIYVMGALFMVLRVVSSYVATVKTEGEPGAGGSFLGHLCDC